VIVDVLLLLLLTGGFILGFFRGVLRQLLALGGWLFAFVAAIYLRLPVGDWLDRSSSQFDFEYAQMLAFTAIFLALFVAALLLFELGGSGLSLVRHPLLDDAFGGVVGVLLAALTAASLIVILDSYFVSRPVPVAGELSWLRDIHDGLSRSALAEPLRDWVIRPLGVLLGPLLPSELRVVMS
jgi:uncharacterized membrane protein required for colicin V production